MATMTPMAGITTPRAIVPAVLKFVLRVDCAAPVEVDEDGGVEAGGVA